VMKELGIPPGPRVGQILNELFERVTDDPKLNTRENLTKIAREIAA
jgi:tRNA nucleotidyltransferase (CCA-adding enzyme)